MKNLTPAKMKQMRDAYREMREAEKVNIKKMNLVTIVEKYLERGAEVPVRTMAAYNKIKKEML